MNEMKRSRWILVGAALLLVALAGWLGWDARQEQRTEELERLKRAYAYTAEVYVRSFYRERRRENQLTQALTPGEAARVQVLWEEDRRKLDEHLNRVVELKGELEGKGLSDQDIEKLEDRANAIEKVEEPKRMEYIRESLRPRGVR